MLYDFCTLARYRLQPLTVGPSCLHSVTFVMTWKVEDIPLHFWWQHSQISRAITINSKVQFYKMSMEISRNRGDEISKPSALVSACEYIKLFIATGVVTLLVLVACVGIINQYSILQLHPVVLFILLVLALVFLMYLESLHFACK